MRVIDRAIERVNVPEVFVTAFDTSAFFGEDVTARESGFYFAEQKSFRGVVGFSNKVNYPFFISSVSSTSAWAISSINSLTYSG